MWKNKVIKNEFNRVWHIIILFIILLLLDSAYAQNSENSGEFESNDVPSSTRASNHIVFAEDFTAEWCVYCPSASETLTNVYNSGGLDFYFVCMITQDKDENVISEDAQARANELSISSYPTVEFDGGYVEVTGAQSDETNYRDAIDTCENRNNIPDIDIDLTAQYDGEAQISIDVTVMNNGDASYSGTLRVYIVEIVSRYFDYDGNHYPFGFLDYAIDTELTISQGTSESQLTTWDGSEIIDGLGNDYSDINPDNIIIFATMMNSENTPIRDRDPDSAILLNLYLIDQAAATYLTEKPLDDADAPEVEIISPANNEEVTGTVEIKAEITDESSIIKVEYQIDNQGIWTAMFDDKDTSDPNDWYRFWETKYELDGPHTLTIRGFDSRNNIGEEFVNLYVKNDFEDPEIEITNLRNGEEVSGVLILSVQATDDTGISEVKYQFDNGPWGDMKSEGFNKYTADIDTAEISDGGHEITIEAKDKSGKTVTESITIKIKNKSSTSDNNNTPGFEIMVVISAIIIIIYISSKKRK